VTLSAAKTTLAPNETVEIRAVITHKIGGFPATQVRALIALPAGTTLVGSPAFDRGSGCIGAENLDCNLDFIMPTMSTLVRFSINVGAAGTKTLSARLTQRETDTDASDSSATITVDVRAPFVPPSGGSGAVATNVVNGTSRADRLSGSAGRDILRGLAGNDQLLGLGGDDRLFGGAGNDRLVGGAGRDLLDAGLGNDTIVANDKTKDTIHCGRGRDSVVADRADIVARDCEAVRRR
jgi:Ca2+-binding RTX toxin-like protein